MKKIPTRILAAKKVTLFLLILVSFCSVFTISCGGGSIVTPVTSTNESAAISESLDRFYVALNTSDYQACLNYCTGSAVDDPQTFIDYLKHKREIEGMIWLDSVGWSSTSNGIASVLALIYTSKAGYQLGMLQEVKMMKQNGDWKLVITTDAILAEKVTEGWLVAFNAGKYDECLSYLSGVNLSNRQSYIDSIQHVREETGPAAIQRIDCEPVSGDTATVYIDLAWGHKGVGRQISLVRENGAWKLDPGFWESF